MKHFTKEEIIKRVLELLIDDMDQSIEGLKLDVVIYTGSLCSAVQNALDEFIEAKDVYSYWKEKVETGDIEKILHNLNSDVEFLHYLDGYLRGSYDMYKRYSGEDKSQQREIVFATLSAINTYGFPVDTGYISMEPLYPDLDKMEVKGIEVKITRLKDVPDILNVLNTDNIEDFSVIYIPSEKSVTARKIISYREAMQRADLLEREVDTIDLCEEEKCLNIWLR